MQLTKGAIGNLINRYKAVLQKCHLMNTFGSLAVAGMLVMGGAAAAGAEPVTTGPEFKSAITNAAAGTTITLGQDIEKGVGVKFENKTVTIDFAGYKYTAYADSVGSAKTETNIFQLLTGSTVTLKNGTIDVALSPDSSGNFKMGLQNYCDLTLENMVVDGSNLKDTQGNVPYTMRNNHGNVVINNSKIIAKEGGVALDAYYWPSNGYADGVSVTVNNSTITGKIEVTVDGKEELQDGAKHQLTLTGGTLTGGLTALRGAQLYNEGTTVISNVAMAKNTASDKGGAIFNSDDKTGAKGDLTLNNVDLKGNNANFGGAIWNEGKLTVNGGSFEGNTADEAAGAIYNADGAKLTVDGVSFKENTAKFGGAINNAKTASDKEAATLTVKNSQFIGNTSLNSQGGAIRNQGIITEISGSTFKGNKASNGGAINNGEWGQIKLITNSVFDGNEATLENTAARDGGAILNRGTIESIADSTFTNNKTSGAGGAILNKNGASLTFNGTNTFTNNTAASKANDIHNSGTITVASGTTTLGSGYSQDAGSLTVQGGAALESLGTMEISGGSVAFTDNSLFAVNGNALTGDNAAITVQGSSQLVVEDKARLRIDNAKSGQTVNIVDGSSVTWKEIEAGTDLLTAKMEGGKVTFNRDKDASDVFTGMDSNTAAMLNTLIDKGLNNVDSDQMGVRFLSRATDNHFLGADKDAAAATIESAARIAFAGAVPQMTKMASDAGTNAVVNRLGFANPADGAQAMDAEGKIVDRNTTGFALWIAPLWQSQHGWGMEAGNLDYGFNGNLGGVSLGADYTFENAIRAGITFNIGGGYAESSGGDLNSTENRMSFWGLGAYAGWNYENFGLMADVSYTSTWNDLKQDVDSRMGMGDLEADVQASAISAGLRAEYKLETSVLDVIPHIGVRYMSLNTWGFDAESNGGTVLEGDGFHQDIWTFPVGVTFTKDFTLDSGWSFKPSIDFSVIPAAGDIKAKQDVAFTGLPGSYEVETQMMDYLTWQGGVGLEMGNDTMSFGVNYTLQAGQHTTGHGVFGSFRYEF